MSATSLIKIDVNDEQFKAFAAAFEKYKAALKDLPKGWTATNLAVASTGATTNKAFDKSLKAQKELNKTSKDGLAVLKDVAHVSTTIAANFASSALSIAKWVSYGGLLGGFGLGGLAYAASDVRRQAQGLGVTTGDLRASSINFGKYIDPEATLSKIADIQNDLSKRQILTRLGAEPGQNAAQMLPSLIENAVKQFKQGGQTSQYADALGLTQVFSLEDLRRLSDAADKGELQKTIRDFQKDRNALAVNDEDSKAMQDFWIQIKRAGESLETDFIKSLAPLAPQLTDLSKAIVGAIGDFLKSDEVRSAFNEFTKYLKSPEVRADLDTFFSVMKMVVGAEKDVLDVFVAIAQGVGKIAGFASTTLDKVENFITGGSTAPQIVGAQGNHVQLGTANSLIENASDIPMTGGAGNKVVGGNDFLSKLESNNHLPAGVLDKMYKVESSRGTLLNSPKGAKGPFQFMPATAEEYGLKNPYDFNTSADAAARKIKHLLDKYHGNIADALAAYNWGEGNLDKFIAGKSTFKQLPTETNDYLHRFGITVNNAAGSDLVITSNGLK